MFYYYLMYYFKYNRNFRKYVFLIKKNNFVYQGVFFGLIFFKIKNNIVSIKSVLYNVLVLYILYM